MDGLFARKIRNEDFEAFNLILAMDRGHYEILDDIRPHNSKAEVRMFLEYATDIAEQDVPDPYYGGDSDFEYALDLVEQGALGLLRSIKETV